MTRTAADLDPKPGDVLILCRDAGDPATLSPRLRKFIKRLGRHHGVEVVWVKDVPAPEPLEVHEDDGEVD